MGHNGEILIWQNDVITWTHCLHYQHKQGIHNWWIPSTNDQSCREFGGFSLVSMDKLCNLQLPWHYREEIPPCHHFFSTGTWGKTAVKSKCHQFHWRKCIWKCCLYNVGQFYFSLNVLTIQLFTHPTYMKCSLQPQLYLTTTWFK